MTLETIVNNMIAANEPESNIAMVIKAFKKVKELKNTKSPLKQIDPDPEEEFKKWIQSSPSVPDQFEQDTKREELRLPPDNSVEAIRRRKKDPVAPQIDLEEVTVTAGEREPVTGVSRQRMMGQAPPSQQRDREQVEKERLIAEKTLQDEDLSGIEQQFLDGIGPRNLTRKELGTQLINSIYKNPISRTINKLLFNALEGNIDEEALQKEEDLKNKLPDIAKGIVDNNTFLNNFPNLVFENNKDLIQNTEERIYGNLIDFKQETYDSIANGSDIQQLKQKLIKQSGIPYVIQNGTLYLAPNVDTKSPQFLKRQNDIAKKLQIEISKKVNNSLKNNNDYINAVASANKENSAFRQSLISDAASKSTTYNNIINKINDEAQSAVQKEIDFRLDKKYSGLGTFGEGFYETALATIPKAYQDFRVLAAGRGIKKINEEIKELKEGKFSTTQDGRIQYVNPGGGTRIYNNVDEAIAQKENLIKERLEDTSEALIRSEQYQKDIANFDQPELFDEDGLTLDDFGKILGTQSVQMLGAIATFGGSTLIQEAGGALDEILSQKAAENLNISIQDFNALSGEEKREALIEELNKGEEYLDTALNVGIANAGLDLVGNFVALGAGTKAMPKGFLKAILRGRYDTASSKYLKPAVANLGKATIFESGTEVGQEVVSLAGVASATGEDVINKLTSPDAVKQYLEAGGQAAIATGPFVGAGKITTSTLNLFRTNPEGLVIRQQAAEEEYNKGVQDVNNLNLSPEQKQIELDKLNNNLEKEFDNLTAANAYIKNTKFKDLKGEAAAEVYDAIAQAVPVQKELIQIENQINQINKAEGTVNPDLLAKQKELLAEQKRLSDITVLARVGQVTGETNKALIKKVNESNEGNLKDKSIKEYNTREQARKDIIKNHGEGKLSDGNVIGLLKGDQKTGLFNNAIIIGNNAYVVKENVKENILGSNRDLAAGNAVAHEVGHFLMDGISYTELDKLRKSTIAELENSTDPKMKKAYEQVKDRLKGYAGTGKGKGGRTALAQEFFTALSDSMAAIEIDNIALEDVSILRKIGNLFSGAINTVAPDELNIGDLNNGANTLEFIKRYNNFDKDTKIVPASEVTEIIKTEKPTLASKPLTIEEINTRVKDVKAGEMPQDLATQIAYAYEPLAQKIASEIFRNYQGEVGYTQGDFAMDIAFGDPKAIGGKNSLVEIAKDYDPNNKEGKSLGGWLGDIGRQRAKRIAEKRIGSQKTTGATKIDAPESVEIEAETTPEVTIEKPKTTVLALPKSMQEAGKEAAQLAAAKAKSDILKNPKATLKQKTTIRDKALTQVMNRAAGKEIKSLIRNLGVDAANDYISNNYKAVAEAFVKDKNINKIRDAKTKKLLQGWKDGNITKDSVTGYFNDPNVKSNTRSDRRNRALTDVISSIIMKESVKDLKASDPKLADDFQEDTGIVLASRPIQGKYNYDIINADYTINEDGINLLSEALKFLTTRSYYDGSLGKATQNTLPTKDKTASPQEKDLLQRFRDVMNNEYEKKKIDFSSNLGSKKITKQKASGFIGNTREAVNAKLKKGQTYKERVAIYNYNGNKTFDNAINLFRKAIKENDALKGKPGYIPTLNTSIKYILNNASAERSAFLANGAAIYSADFSNGKITWEHAVPVKKAAQIISDALFDLSSKYKGKTFDEVITALKGNYKQIGIPEVLLKDSGISKFTMPTGWNLFNDSWTARYDAVKDKLNLKNQKLVFPNGQQNVLASRPLSREFNKMIERNKGIPARATYSIQRANRLGKKANRGWKPFVPYSNEDYLGLVYATLGEGKQGEKDLQWWKDNVMIPYNEGMTAFETAKEAAMLEWKEIQKKIKNTPNNLNKEAISDFTNQDAVRVYLWNKQDVLPDSKDLSKKDVRSLVKHVNSKPELKKFANELQGLSPNGYPSPTRNWGSGTITTDLVNYVNTETRAQYLQPWQEAVDAIYTPNNMLKLKAQFGNGYVEALEDSLYRMKSGRNRPDGANQQTNLWLNWVNDSVGTIMFFNMRSALLQTISTINFVNWSDNNPARAAAAFANQKQYWNDFSTLWNSDFLKQRRSGLKTDVNADEIAASAAASTNKVRAALSYILKKGFLPTQTADSFAIASGGATFYRNRIKSLMKEGMSKADAETQAFQDFRNLANESQQSSDPSKISSEQASSLGRLILAFANTPIQYTRLTKRALQDLANKRGDWKTNISKIVYYGFAQNVIFTGLQQAMFGLMFTDDDEDLGKNESKFREEQKSNSAFNIANSTADMFLRGSGVGGAFIAMFKNMALEIKRQSEKSRTDYERVADKIFTLSPPIDSKFKKLQDVGRKFTYRQELEKMRERGFAIDNPALEAAAKTISALGNVPADRVIKKLNNLKTATDEETKLWQQIALLMGWGEWELGIQARKRDEINIINKRKKEEIKKIKSLQKTIDKIDKSKTPIKASLPEGTLGQANKDGTIDIADGLSEKKKKEVIAHELRHKKEIDSGKLDYDDDFIYYGKKKFERKNGMIAHNGSWKQEGDHSLPWEKFANNYKSKSA